MSMIVNMAVDADNIFTTPDLKGFWYGFKDTLDFDQESFFQLFQDTNEDTTLRILARFNENLVESIQKISAAMQVEDCEVIWRACHKLAGSAELLGFKKFGGVSRELSVEVRANPVYSSHAVELEEYVAKLSSLTKQIKNFCPNLASYL